MYFSASLLTSESACRREAALRLVPYSVRRQAFADLVVHVLDITEEWISSRREHLRGTLLGEAPPRGAAGLRPATSKSRVNTTSVILTLTEVV